METFFTGITNFGFPIALSAFLIYGYITVLNKLQDSITGESGLRAWIRELPRVIIVLSETYKEDMTNDQNRRLDNSVEKLDKMREKQC
jgi:hypothetical protein